jgi:PAS domain S-box-containing protein
VVGIYGRGKLTGNEVIRLTYPILASDGSVSGVLTVGLNLKWLGASIVGWQLPADSVIDVADREGTLLARRPGAEWVGQKLPESLRMAVDAPEAGTRLGTGLDGVHRVYGYVPVSFGEMPSVLIFVGLDSEAALAEIDRSTWRSILLVSVLLYGAALIAWVYIRRFIGRPIKDLVGAAARWQAGDWTARAESERGIAELEQLAKAFDAMAETVAARESALRRSQQHLIRAQRVAAIGSWETDCRTGKLEWSEEYYRILGVSPDTFQPTPEAFHRMVVEEDRSKLRTSIALLREGRSVPSLEFRVTRADGAIRTLYREAEPLFDAGGSPIGYFGSVRDVTEARETERQLRRSREHLAQAQRVAATGSFELDFHTNRIEWSDETYRIFGVRRDSGPLDIAAVEAMVLAEDREYFRAPITLGRQGHGGPSPEYRIRRPDGVIRTIYREAEPVFDETCKATGLFGVVKDVTELREAERQRDELGRQLIHSQKLEALGTLSGGVAHDLNNTLVPILALSKLALEELPESNPVRGDIETIIRASERARDLVKQILAFSRKQDLVRRAVDLPAVTREALHMLRASLPTTIEIVEQISQVPLLFGDPGGLHQVLVNLVTNAAQAIGGRVGRITISIWETTETPSPLHRGPTERAVCLSVADTGRGMDEATLDRIFEPFFTTKEVGDGTGLGLSVAHGIVTSHGGRIAVKSRPGHGTRFDVYLPAVAEIPIGHHGEAA